MVNNQDIIDHVSNLCEGTVFSDFEITRFDSGEVILSEKRNDVIRYLIMSFRLSEIGKSINSISSSLMHSKLESFIEPIATLNNLPYGASKERTLTYSASEPKLYRKLTSEEVNNIDTYKGLIQKFVLDEIIPFFESRGTIEGLGEYVLQHPFDNIINIGLGGEYPVNLLKAITIAKWCGNEVKYEEYTKGLQTWIDEDRNDPNYAKMCDAYQGALDELKEKLSEHTLI